MKILIISKEFPTNKNNPYLSFVYEEAYRLNKKGIKVHVNRWLFGEDEVSEGIYIHNLPRSIVSAIPFGLRRLLEFPLSSYFHPLESIFYSRYGKSIADTVKKHSIDILHAHFACPEGFVAKLAKNSKIPLVITLHGYDILLDPSIGYGNRLEKSFDDKVRSALDEADKILVASKFVYREAEKIVNDRNKLVLIPNGVDLNIFNPEIDGFKIRKLLNIDINKKVIMSIRRYRPVYGLELLVKAAYVVIKHFPNTIFVIGGGEGPTRSSIERLVNKLDLTRNVILIGEISRIEIPYYFAACDIFVLPSILEAFGIVALEAMASGKPVIGSDVGGIPDVVIDKKTGFLFKPGDVSDLARKIKYLLNNPKICKVMGRKGRLRAQEKFDINTRINRIIGVYEEILDK